MIKRGFLVAAALVFAMGGQLPAAAGPIVISGSTTFQKRILEPVQGALEKKTGVSIELRGVGSIKGLKDLIRGEAAAAMVSVPLDTAFRETGVPEEGTYREHIILKDIVVPIVHPMNRVKSLTLEQLADINSGKIDNWKSVGGTNDRIALVVPPRGSGTRAFLQETVLNGVEFTGSAFTAVTTREEIDLVARSSIAIGALSQGFVSLNPGKVKIVKMKKPIVRQLSIVTRGDPSPELLAVINYLKSAEAKKRFK